MSVCRVKSETSSRGNPSYGLCLFALGVLTSIPLANLHAQARNEAIAELSGTVNGAAGARVMLHLRRLDDSPIRYYDGYEETSAAGGTFQFAEIRPGSYQLETGPGFVLPSPITVTLRPGERRTGLAVSVTPSYSLCGRVTENGTPKNNTWVNAYRYIPEFDTLSKTFFPHTGPDGSFLIPDLPPGAYYLEGYTTFYPGSFSFNGAKPLVVGPGGVAGCALEIPLQPTGCRVTQVSGRIAAPSGDATGQYRVLFLATNPAGGRKLAQIAVQATDVYNAGDVFGIGVCPGDYDVVLTDTDHYYGLDWGVWTDGAPRNVVFDSRHVRVGATPVDNVLLTPRVMASITGEVPGMTHSVSCPTGGPRARVSILRQGDGQYYSVELDDKNRFSFSNVALGEYDVFVGPIAREELYLDSILVNGKPISGRRFSVTQARPMTMVINISSDVSRAAGHLSPDVRHELRWEVSWARPKGSVAGTVAGPNSGSITVKLRSARYNSNASGEYTALTTANGAFRFDDVDPGVYFLRAEGRGLVTVEYGALAPGERGTPVIVERGAHLQGLVLSPPRFGSICGRLVDAQGVPQPRMRVFPQWDPGRFHTGLGVPSEVTTDAEGRFRVDSAAPGDYFFASPLDVNRIVFFSPDGTLRTMTPLHLEPGRDLGCSAGPDVELRTPPDYRATYSFSGRVVGDLPPIVGDRFWVVLLDKHASGAQTFVGRANLDSERRFFLDNVPGGEFALHLWSGYGPEPDSWPGPYGPATHLLASQTVRVNGALKELAVAPMSLPRVTGAVHFDHVPETWQKDIYSGQIISLASPEFNKAPSSAKLAADGGFTIEPVDVGDYEVELVFLRAPLYIKSIRLNGQEVHGRYLYLNAGAAVRLDVEASGDSGTVKARIQADRSLPAPEPPLRVPCSREAWPQYEFVLIPEALSASQSAAPLTEQHLIFSYEIEDEPRFQVQGVPPGNYRALAFDGLEIVGFPSREFIGDQALRQRALSALATLGEPIEVEPGQAVEISLPDRTMDIEHVAASLGVPLDRALLQR